MKAPMLVASVKPLSLIYTQFLDHSERRYPEICWVVQYSQEIVSFLKALISQSLLLLQFGDSQEKKKNFQ